MLIGILFTGSLRTIVKTIKLMKENLLLDNNRHVFACIQNDTNQTNEHWNEWLVSHLGKHLKTIDWYVQNNTEKEEILRYVNISNNWKDYLKSSGSIIEHHQVQISYKKLCYVESLSNIKYNYIIRYRTDTVFGKKIDFHWLNWTQEEINQRLNKIKDKVSENDINKYFMATLLDDSIINNDNLKLSLIGNESIDDMKDYLKNGKYILTFRKNLLYIVNREYFYLIPCIYNLYGTIRFKYNDDYWFNSEGQFQGACYNSGLTIYDYNSEFDDMSLYNYNESRYFDKDYNVINPYMIYCLVRN